MTPDKMTLQSIIEYCEEQLLNIEIDRRVSTKTDIGGLTATNKGRKDAYNDVLRHARTILNAGTHAATGKPHRQ